MAGGGQMYNSRQLKVFQQLLRIAGGASSWGSASKTKQFKLVVLRFKLCTVFHFYHGI